MSGSLFIVSAPSGAGKTSLVGALLATDPQVRKSVSYTTRAPRPGEADGREYHFVSVAEFERMQARGEFLESAHVHGNRYGTSRAWVAAETRKGHDILLEIDWQGAAQVRKLLPQAVSIFILPPSLAALEARLTHVGEFEYVIINEDFSRAMQDLVSIIRAERLKLARQLARHNDLINRMK
jgi:guanylate kinase